MMKHELTEAESEMEEKNENIKEMIILKGSMKISHCWKNNMRHGG